MFKAAAVACWFAIYWLFLPPFHHPVRLALRQDGIEKHTTLARW